MGEAGASSVFRVEEEQPPRRERVRRMLTALGLGAVLGASHTNPGGQRLRIIDSSSGDIVATWTEQAGDDARMLAGQMRSDLETMNADDFAARWVP